MAEVDFIFNSNTTVIQCNSNEKMIEICKRYLTKINKKFDELHFIYEGQVLNKNSLELSYNKISKQLSKICILVYEFKQEEEIKNKIIKSDEIICPKCKECIRININNYKIKLYNCKNRHCIDNISFKEFDNTQNIDISKIICDECKKKNKCDSNNNLFYRCNDCKRNLCIFCKSKHNKLHNIIDYDTHNYICELHNEKYISYCYNCLMNICQLCEKNHINHDTEYYKLIPDKDKKIDELNSLRKLINEMKLHLNEIINKIVMVIENIEYYYNICSDYINSYNIKNRNYELLINMKEIINIDIINDINHIIYSKDIYNKFNKVIEIYDKIKYEPNIQNTSSKPSTDGSISDKNEEFLPRMVVQEIKINPLSQKATSKSSINDDSEKKEGGDSFISKMSKLESKMSNKIVQGPEINPLSQKTSSQPSIIGDSEEKKGGGSFAEKMAKLQARMGKQNTKELEIKPKSQKTSSQPSIIGDSEEKEGGDSFAKKMAKLQARMAGNK